MVAVVDILPAMPRKPLPPSDKKVGIAARIDPTLLSELQDAARADERTISFLVEKAIRQYLEGLRGKPKKR